MKRMIPLLALLLVPGAIAFAQEEAQPADPAPAEEAAPEESMSPEEVASKASYGLGLQMGRNFKFQEFDVDIELMMQGVKDGLSGTQPKFAGDEIQAAIRTSQEAASKAISARNRALAEAYLAANSKKQGVYTLPSGLQYEVLKEGGGPKPSAEDRVTVRYRSTLVDGTELDNTLDQGEPETHAVSGLIPAWVEALQLMPVGSRWRLFVPSELAHGDQGSGRIGPGVVAIFELELLGIAEAEPAADEAASDPSGGGV